ncbi:L,D-transpeptidase [Rhizobium sp. RU36D]|uniref:L,D-transpeptidase n=1 Tax=Rhizobium sp. RU36D TaxID=1907415 RepID=UPI0009D7C3AE|nr:L,D-transpeptidase [Rhizobium sp. RU36D]SMC96530.1 Tat (twin-arginine translocation) pathway signal sequence [Rhizobium sp. RU36D]
MSSSNTLSRRGFLTFSALGAAAALTSCASYRSGASITATPVYGDGIGVPIRASGYGASPELDAMYGEVLDNGYLIPAVPYERIDPRFYRQRVVDPTGQPPGTIVVDTPSRFLYLVESGGTAMRYGVGIGREGFAWQGQGVIQWRQKWPKWTPPDDMIRRQPELAQYSAANGGMAPGLTNPLGARALYIFQGGEDTLYRLHGSPEWNSIGRAVSSGCVRLMNQDIIDLYDRVPNKARIMVMQ